MSFSVPGRGICRSESQWLKASVSITVTPSGMLMPFSDLQLWKASLPMVLVLGLMLTVRSFSQP